MAERTAEEMGQRNRGAGERPRTSVLWCPQREAFGEEGGLGGSATTGGELSDVVEEDGTLEGVELRGVVGDLGEEGIGHEDVGLVLMAVVAVAKEDGDIDLKGAREAIEGGEGGHGLSVFDFGDVGAGHAHARGELALGEVADVAQVADGAET